MSVIRSDLYRRSLVVWLECRSCSRTLVWTLNRTLVRTYCRILSRLLVARTITRTVYCRSVSRSLYSIARLHIS